MNVVVIPDGAMIIVPFIEKNGHTYLSPTNFSKYDNELNLNIDFDNLINSYLSSEVPSGVRGRISLLAPVLKKADAAIILGSRPPYYKPMYNVLNELILFCGKGCINAHSVAIKILSELNIPILKLAYPTTRSEIINLIERVNLFLKNLETLDKTVNDDNLNVDLSNKSDKIPFNEFKKILNKTF